MREDLIGLPIVPRRSNPLVRRLRGIGAPLSALSLLVSEVEDALGARRKRGRHNGDNAGNDDRKRDRHQERDAGREDKRDRDDRNDRGDRHHDDRHRQRAQDNGNDANSDVDAAAKNNKNKNQNNNNNNNNDRNNRNKDDEPNNNDNNDNTDDTDDTNDGGGGGGGGNDRGNAGSGFFDSPLATKARRRANDFDNNADGDNDEEDRTGADINPDGDSTFHTGSISYTTGPDGIEIVTRHITYTAPPPPPPPELPRLELPTRESTVFGNLSPATVATGDVETGDAAVAPPAEPSPSESAPSDGGAVNLGTPNPIPTLPDMDGGDNTVDFLS
jgi:hypothetical protein